MSPPFQVTQAFLPTLHTVIMHVCWQLSSADCADDALPLWEVSVTR